MSENTYEVIERMKRKWLETAELYADSCRCVTELDRRLAEKDKEIADMRAFIQCQQEKVRYAQNETAIACVKMVDQEELLTVYRLRFHNDGHGMKSVNGEWVEIAPYDSLVQYETAKKIHVMEAANEKSVGSTSTGI